MTGASAAHSDDFDGERSLSDIKSTFRRVGEQAIEKLLIAWHVAVDPRTPLWARGVLGSALVYFGMPLDAVPDFLPIGYTDDLTLLVSALAATAMCVRFRHFRMARQTMRAWGMKVPVPDSEPDDDERI